MEVVLSIETKNYQKVREVLLKDPVISLASIQFKDAKSYGGKDGYYCYISGLDNQCKKALELTKDLVNEVKDKEKENIIIKIKKEETEATAAFGNLF